MEDRGAVRWSSPAPRQSPVGSRLESRVSGWNRDSNTKGTINTNVNPEGC